jgi:glycine betaine catabolism B
MASVRDMLAEIGYDMRNYHEESFSFESLSVPAWPAVDTNHQVLTETARPLGDQAPPLDAVSQETSATAYSVEFVRTGRTITCEHNGGIRPREIAQNKILICCSKPQSDLRIDC